VSEVVDGIAAFRPMETAPALAELGISLRPFDASVFRPGHRDAVAHGPERPRGSARSQPPEGQEDGYRLALVGSGRIGTAHAVSALHHPDTHLCALVDPSKAAISRLRSVLGRPVAHYTSIDELLASPERPDAAIVATPPGTHADLARRLLDERIRVLVEKPLAPQASRASLLQAAARAARCGIASATGYHMLYLPHLEEARIRFLAGEFGTPQRFCTLGFVTRAESGRGLSWELNPLLAGGGALSHIPAHALSILDRLLGPLEAIESTLVYARNQSVDDAAWVHLGNGNVDGSLFTCWHLPGFIAPETSVRIETNSGLLILTPASAAFFAHDGTAPFILTALDTAVRGFDPAPLDAGFGFWREQRSLLDQEEIRTSFLVADRIERTVDQAYAKATAIHLPSPPTDIDPRIRTVSTLNAASVPSRRSTQADADSGTAASGPLVLVDVRNLVIRSVDLDGGERYVVNPEQIRSLRASPPLVVTPNVPKIFRTATNDGFGALARYFGARNLAAAAVRVQPHRLLAEAERFWEVFNTLLQADMGHLPGHYPGRVALDGYLVDLAASLGRFDELVRLFRTLRRRLPNAELGLESNAPDLLCRVLPVVSSHVSFVVGVGSPQLALADRVRRVADRPDLGVIIKCGQQPPEVTQFAATHAGLWAGDAEALVIDGRAAPEFIALSAANLRRALVSTGCPDWAEADACELLGI
ncbi:MAG: Gfo/Idh/MocA family oxidoreductase, partial [Acidimicrobiales bacterium]|nr:Gfo/Idh/MocA family oxidoreductase [Acidimicrobiales bacterium]